ncbi:hypothetical protein C5167_006092, partial [Papaver somniferum]
MLSILLTEAPVSKVIMRTLFLLLHSLKERLRRKKLLLWPWPNTSRCTNTSRIRMLII